MTDHTPTPWFMAPPYLDIIYGPEHAVICREPNNPENGKNWTADAAFIVKAVNSHAPIMEVLRKLLLTAELLQQNSVGCAELHHGLDTHLNGLPGWLVDTQRDIEAAKAVLGAVGDAGTP